ncbi:MAG TPA: HAD family hydrolase [Pyrinomonadaceae bacterium]|nr:HAD family hydrolase [Pyrinomonadaceae bacterium]
MDQSTAEAATASSFAGGLDRLHPALRGARAVLFDVGGTLTHPDWQRLAELARAEAGREFDGAELDRVFKDGLREVDLCLKQGAPPPFDTTRRNWTFARMYAGLGLSDESCERLRARLDALHEERHLWCGIDRDAPRVLDAIHAAGLRTAAISNTEDGRLEELMRLVGLADRFDFILDSFVVGLRKPDPAIFRLALERLGLDPREAVYVGDSYGHDALPALALGLGAVLVDPLDLHPESICPRVRSLGGLVEHGGAAAG